MSALVEVSAVRLLLDVILRSGWCCGLCRGVVVGVPLFPRALQKPRKHRTKSSIDFLRRPRITVSSILTVCDAPQPSAPVLLGHRCRSPHWLRMWRPRRLGRPRACLLRLWLPFRDALPFRCRDRRSCGTRLSSTPRRWHSRLLRVARTRSRKRPRLSRRCVRNARRKRERNANQPAKPWPQPESPWSSRSRVTHRGR